MALPQTQVTLEQARLAKRAGNVVQARNLLSQIIKANPRDEDAWLLLAEVAEKPEHATYCLDQVLKLNPVNMLAVERLHALKTPPQPVATRPPSPAVERIPSGVGEGVRAAQGVRVEDRSTTGAGEEPAPAREVVIIEERMSGVLFLLPVIIALIGVSVGLFIGSMPGLGMNWVGLIAAAGFVLAAVLEDLKLIGAYLSHRLILTNKRILIKRGLLSRSTFEVLLTKVEGIGIRQPLLGRMLNFGTIVVTGTGGAHQVFRGIREPQAIRQRLQAEVDRVQARG